MAGKKGGSGSWLIILAVVIVVGAGAAYFLTTRDEAAKLQTKPAAGAPTGAVPASAAADAADPTAPILPQLSVPDLLKNGSAAIADGRLIEPPGNNAIEYYLGVLLQQPDNRSARDALLEIFPLATSAVERQINSDHVDDAARSIVLLSKADHDNYALTILRNKLDGKRKQLEKDQEKLQAANAAKNSPATQANSPASSTTPPAPGTTPAAAPAVPAATTATTAVTTPSSAAAQPVAPAPAVAAAPAGGETRAAALTQKVNPSYPPEAARRHQEGWVEVSFTVGSDGHVKDAFVVGANPSRVFDNAALQAVANWTFQPRLESGKAVEQHIKSRIEFKL